VPPKGVRVRALELSDIPGCAALLARLPQWFGIPESNAAYLRSLERLPAFVAVRDDEIVGFLALESHTPRSVEITVMGVDPALHRHGIGDALVAAAEQWCTDHEVEWLHVKTRGPSTYDDDYERTRRFYGAEGFGVLYESLTEWGSENAALVLVKHLRCDRREPAASRSSRSSTPPPA
jgi:GNAT superfamily N-acetyltransferase